ncbi:gamma-mobile-trio protein GmtX [Marinomonas gallaica]|uniref:gamma-mobile-trio protein GmtX n=1 Tax=Marinomonas gallaica TaxID=1806667 RepID=UPI003A8EF46E
MNAKDFLDQIKKDSSNRVQQSLDAIYHVCLTQLKNGETDFSYATISRIGQDRGVPRAQSIRNKSGEKYQQLIAHFKKEAEKKYPKKLNRTDEDWVEKITDPTTKILVRQLIHENKRLKSELNEIIPPSSLIEIRDHRSDDGHVERLEDFERRALESLLSERILNKLSLSIDSMGAFKDINNKIVFPIGTATALKKCLKNL